LSTLSRTELLQLARAGAGVRVAELRREIETIYRSFPELRHGRPAGTVRGRRRTKPMAAGVEHANESAGRKQRGWTAAQRRAVSVRMRRYWSARRATEKKTGR
jgi:hypothetical protein